MPSLILTVSGKYRFFFSAYKNGDFADWARFQRIQESFGGLMGEDLSFD
jgi:hypothetical protein